MLNRINHGGMNLFLYDFIAENFKFRSIKSSESRSGIKLVCGRARPF